MLRDYRCARHGRHIYYISRLPLIPIPSLRCLCPSCGKTEIYIERKEMFQEERGERRGDFFEPKKYTHSTSLGSSV